MAIVREGVACGIEAKKSDSGPNEAINLKLQGGFEVDYTSLTRNRQ